MTLINKLKYKLRYKLGFVPLFSSYIFYDADAIFRKLRDDGFVQYIRNMRPSERRMLHFSFGMEIRNAFLLWHPKNPHTMLKLAELSDERQAASPFHPDNFSWSIISRLTVASNLAGSNGSLMDTSETLMYSLMARADDHEDTLEGIRLAVADLVGAEQWELLDDVFEETIEGSTISDVLGMTQSTKITPVNYLRVAKRAISYGVQIPREDGI
jgi:hypothetical protein